jgi:hypothetical protein
MLTSILQDNTIQLLLLSKTHTTMNVERRPC